jgi:hypothetical protein
MKRKRINELSPEAALERRAYMRQWFLRNQEKINERRRNDRALNPKKHADANKRYSRQDPAGFRARQKEAKRRYLATVSGRANEMLRAASVRAKDRGVEFGLTREWLIPLLSPLKCMATGARLTLDRGLKDHAHAPAIDRKNNLGGYTADNCWVVSKSFNSRKRRKSLEELGITT